MIGRGFLLFAAYLVCLSTANVSPQQSSPDEDLVPRLSLQNLEAGYHGLVKENETIVEVTPKIRGVGANICDFHIVNKHHGEAPFQIILKEGGEAELRAKKILNCEKRKNYKFDIAAISCSGQQSEKGNIENNHLVCKSHRTTHYRKALGYTVSRVYHF